MEPTIGPKYEEQFTAFIDLLGFKEFSMRKDDESVEKRKEVLDFLLSLSALRGDSGVESWVHENGKTSFIKPAVSTFSDHIVISFPLEPISAEMELDEEFTLFNILHQFNRLLTQIAVAALRIGFLIRGGASVGKLYHANGVVFGEALVDAFQIESRSSVYPRVVLSHKIVRRLTWIEKQPDVMKDDDGLYILDYFKRLVVSAAIPADSHAESIKAWIEVAMGIASRNLKELERQGKLNELAKWAWFVHEFRRGLERQTPEYLNAVGISLDTILWPK